MNIIEKKKRQMGQGGFTLIELLVVLAILAVLAGLAVIGIGAMRGNANEQACKADIDTYQTAAEAYYVDNNSTYPSLAQLASSGLIKRPSKWASTMVINASTGDVTNTSGDCA